MSVSQLTIRLKISIEISQQLEQSEGNNEMHHHDINHDILHIGYGYKCRACIETHCDKYLAKCLHPMSAGCPKKQLFHVLREVIYEGT